MNYEQLKLLVEENHSTHSIATILNISQTNTRYWLKKYNLTTNPVKKKKECKHCEKPLQNSSSIYCTVNCQKEFEYEQYILDWKNGLKLGYVSKTKKIANAVRKYMLIKNNNTCQECGWNKLHPIDNKPLVEIDHIDGDASNCTEANLRVLCPNCHSMTPTFRARNKNSSRDRS